MPPTKRAAIYARFSSDRQNERSSRDQIALCSAWAERQGLAVVDAYHDDAVSGASTCNRFGLAALMRDAGSGRFDVVVCEALDRLSRDQADLATLRKRLGFLSIGIMTVQDGEVGAMHIGLKGLMGELYLADLAQKTRRGQQARVREGAIGGGRSYGYAPVAGHPGRLTIVPAEAAIVRRVFAEYAAGDAPRAIVARLNAEAVPGPRGGRWNASALNGSTRRRNGILLNALYAGEIVWNRQRFLKDPETGRRVSRPNPESEWVRKAVPELRIVDAATWAAVARRKAELGLVLPAHQRRPRHVFSGLVKCGCCGASYTVVGNGRLGCAGHKERGDCANARTVALAELERRVLEALATQLADPDVMAEYVRAYQAERTRIAREARRAEHGDRRRLAELQRTIARTVDLLVTGQAPAALMDKLRELEAEKDGLERRLAETADAAAVTLHPGAAERYRRVIQDLRATQAAGRENGDELLDMVRSLIQRIVVEPRTSKEPVDLIVHGLLASLMISQEDRATKRWGLMVAGTRNDQSPTFRLVA